MWEAVGGHVGDRVGGRGRPCSLIGCDRWEAMWEAVQEAVRGQIGRLWEAV